MTGESDRSSGLEHEKKIVFEGINLRLHPDGSVHCNGEMNPLLMRR